MAVFNSGSTVGLVIEPGSVRAVAVDRVRGDVGVTAFAEARIGTSPDDEDYLEILAGAVRELFEANSLPRDRVVACLSSSDAVLRSVSLPFEDESRIRKTVRFEVEDALPFPIDECVADYHVGRKGDGRTDVLVAAVGKQRVRDVLGVLEGCGLETVALELDLAAMANAAAWTGLGDGCSLLVDVGQDATRFVVYQGSIIFWRGFRTDTGGVGDVAKKVAGELRRSLLSADLPEEPGKIYLSGSHPGLAQLVGALADEMDMEVKPLEEPHDRMGDGVSWQEVSSRGFIALGCALKYSGYDVSTMNMRQDEFVYRRKFEQLTPALSVLASVVLAFGVLWNVRLAVVQSGVWKQQQEMRENALELWQDAGVSQDEDVPETIAGMKKRVEELVAFIKPGQSQKKVSVRSVLDEWMDWSQRVPSEIDLLLEEMNMRQKTIQLVGTVPGLADTEKLQEALNRDDKFSFGVTQTKTTPDERTRFTLRHEYK